jgi:hypothetical protein
MYGALLIVEEMAGREEKQSRLASNLSTDWGVSQNMYVKLTNSGNERPRLASRGFDGANWRALCDVLQQSVDLREALLRRPRVQDSGESHGGCAESCCELRGWVLFVYDDACSQRPNEIHVGFGSGRYHSYTRRGGELYG